MNWAKCRQWSRLVTKNYAKAQVLAQIFAVGSIFPLIMTRKNSIASRKLPRRFNPIPKFWSLSASAAHTWAHVPQSNFWIINSITCFLLQSATHRKFSLSATQFPVHTFTTCWILLMTKTSPSTLSPSPARQRNLQSHSASSRKSLLKSMARKAQRNASMQRRIALAVLLRRKQTQKVTNAS